MHRRLSIDLLEQDNLPKIWNSKEFFGLNIGNTSDTPETLFTKEIKQNLIGSDEAKECEG